MLPYDPSPPPRPDPWPLPVGLALGGVVAGAAVVAHAGGWAPSDGGWGDLCHPLVAAGHAVFLAVLWCVLRTGLWSFSSRRFLEGGGGRDRPQFALDQPYHLWLGERRRGAAERQEHVAAVAAEEEERAVW